MNAKDFFVASATVLPVLYVPVVLELAALRSRHPAKARELVTYSILMVIFSLGEFSALLSITHDHESLTSNDVFAVATILLAALGGIALSWAPLVEALRPVKGAPRLWPRLVVLEVLFLAAVAGPAALVWIRFRHELPVWVALASAALLFVVALALWVCGPVASNPDDQVSTQTQVAGPDEAGRVPGLGRPRPGPTMTVIVDWHDGPPRPVTVVISSTDGSRGPN